jgi:hypothetical protein
MGQGSISGNTKTQTNLLNFCLYLREDLAALGNKFFYAAEMAGMRSDTYMYKDLKEYLLSKGILLRTQHDQPLEQADIIICLNETAFFETYQRSRNNKGIFLILTEPPVYNSKDWTKERHKYFDLVFTYDTSLISTNPNKYKRIAFPIDFSNLEYQPFPNEAAFKNRRHACMVAGAFAITTGPKEHKSLLYERYKILKWYNQHGPDQLDFFSRGNPLDKFVFFRGSSLLRSVHPSIVTLVANLLFRRNIKKVFKGAIPALEKGKVMNGYNFSFCLENVYGINGSCSEKIFDCFYSKTIPIYYGAPDLDKYIPSNCYIDYGNFKNLSELNNYLKKMDYKEYHSYLQNAENFLNSDMASVFSTDNFVRSICNNIALTTALEKPI